MPQEKMRPSFTFDKERIEQLRAVVPEAFADGKINWDVLHAALGDNLESEIADTEHFGLFWPGKREARRLANVPSTGTLIPAKGEGIDEDQTHNLFIEGDNLEVLKILQKSYAGRLKMIYIDPPYNTGNDFIYNDVFQEPLESYLIQTGQSDQEGKVLVTNPKSSGRYHSNWLNMMYPRLRLARNLLDDDGVIFVSIDDNEIHHLRMLMNDTFGEENFVAILPWKGRGGRQASSHLAEIHEFILLYANNINDFSAGGKIKEGEVFPKFDQLKKKRYKTQLARKWGSASRRQDRPNLFYSISGPNGADVFPKLPDGNDGRWRFGKDTMANKISEGLIEFNNDKGQWIAYEKIYEPSEGEERINKFNTWLDDVGTTANGTDELKQLFDGKVPFDFPKPTSLIYRLAQIANVSENGDLIMDFFAGSSTTAHAIMNKAKDDNKTYNYIMVQLPESTPDESIANNLGLNNIAEIGKERIRKAITIKKTEKAKGDLGFKVFKLDHSNYKAWEDYHGEDIKQLEMLFDGAETPLTEGWTSESLLTEIMLIQGFPLDSTISTQSECKQNVIKIVTSQTIEHRLLTCLDEKIKEDTLTRLKFNAGDIFVCLDSAMTDQAKMRIANKCILRTI